MPDDGVIKGASLAPFQAPQQQQQPQAPQQQQQSAPPAQAGGLDSAAVNLSKAIRQYESGNNPTLKGASGEYGAYQFTEPTWNEYSREAGVNVPLTQATPEQQNEVAYKKIKGWKDQGFNVGQVASMWNAGPGRPNAYLEGNKGTNKFGVPYDTKDYAKQVATIYQHLKTSSSSDGTPAADAPAAKQNDSANADSSLTGIPAVDSIANFLFPIAGDIKGDIQGTSQKSALQQAGDAGLSALPFVPGLGALGEGAGLMTRLLGGAALGYGAGALSNLSQGQDVGSAISPNLGTVGGALTGGAANAILPKILAPFAKNFTKGGAQSALENSLTTEVNRTKPVQNLMRTMPGQGKGAIETIARTPEALRGIEVIDNHHFDTTKAIPGLVAKENALSELRAEAMDKMGINHSLDDLWGNAVKEMAGKTNPDTFDRPQQNQQMLGDLTAIMKRYGPNLTSKQVQEIKSSFYGKNPYISAAARKMLEESSSKAGAPDLKILNGEIQKYINAQKILRKFNGQVVKGGRLGNMLRGHTAALVGGAAGDALGGGFTGLIGGALAGEGMSKLLSNWSANTALTTPFQQAILERLQREDPEIVQQFAQYVGREGQVAPQTAAPSTNPQLGGLLRNLLVTSASRVPSGAQTQ